MAVAPMRKNVSRNNYESKTNNEIKNEIKNNDWVEIDISSISSPVFHDRKYIDKYSLIELSKNIEKEGLIYPVVVRKLENGSLERLIGYRRIEACKILKMDKIKAIILENISDSQAMLLMITENIQRENLSIYDETLALIDYISASLSIDSKETIKLLHRYKNFNAGRVELKHSEKITYEKIEEILEKTGKININGMTNRLSIFNVQDILKDKLSEGSLSFSNAQILNKILDRDTLVKIMNIVITEKYSKRETLKLVNKSLPIVEKNKDSLAFNLKKVAKIKTSKLNNSDKRDIEELINKILSIAKTD